MGATDSRRRLRLMNEVLPDPTLNRAPSRAGGPRDRTMNHMQALLATAAATAAVGCGAKEEPNAVPSGSTQPAATSAATPGDAPSITQKDPTPPASASAAPSAVASTSASAAPSSSAIASSTPTNTTPPVVPTPPTRTPYIVVDPMPPPYRNGKTGPNHP